MSSKTFTVRRATPSDADAIARVHVESWRDAYAGLLTDDQIATRTVEGRTKQWRESLDGDKPGIVLVAEDDDGIFGFLSAQQDEEDPTSVDLAALYLVERGWGTGAGAELMHRALEALAADGRYDDVFLWVLEGNDRARRFYEKEGWHSDGGTKDCFGGIDAPAVRYRKALGPKVE